MSKNWFIIYAAFMVSCGVSKSTETYTSGSDAGSDAGSGDTRTVPVEMLDTKTYLLTEQSDDPTYGFEQSNPIKVGGARNNTGPLNEQRFLNALLGPDGEPVQYYREGSCCSFKTPNALYGDIGLLDLYKVTAKGSKTVEIYINMYDEGDLKIPVGFTAKN